MTPLIPKFGQPACHRDQMLGILWVFPPPLGGEGITATVTNHAEKGAVLVWRHWEEIVKREIFDSIQAAVLEYMRSLRNFDRGNPHVPIDDKDRAVWDLPPCVDDQYHVYAVTDGAAPGRRFTVQSPFNTDTPSWCYFDKLEEAIDYFHERVNKERLRLSDSNIDDAMDVVASAIEELGNHRRRVQLLHDSHEEMKAKLEEAQKERDQAQRDLKALKSRVLPSVAETKLQIEFLTQERDHYKQQAEEALERVARVTERAQGMSSALFDAVRKDQEREAALRKMTAQVRHACDQLGNPGLMSAREINEAQSFHDFYFKGSTLDPDVYGLH